MPWNQNDPNNPNNPWGNRPSGGGGGNQVPPDIDEAIKRLQQRLGNIFGGRGGRGGEGGDLPKSPFVAGLLGIALVAGLIYFCSFVVAADEEAVVLRFGLFNRVATPGWNWKMPSPAETVEKVPVTRVQRLEIGFRDFGEGRIRKVPQEALMLTKDENIVEISFVVQYKVKDVEAYLFNIDSQLKTVRDASESAIREVIGRTMIDDVLTTKKAEVENETRDLIQSILDGYASGISVTNIKLQDVKPPEQVDKEFKDVASAREDRERAKNEAQAYANDIIPKARGESKKMILDAEGYEKEAIDRAKGDAARFESMLAAYRKAPEVTRKRLYIETMQDVLAKADKVIVEGKVAERVLPYLPLDRAGKAEVKR